MQTERINMFHNDPTRTQYEYRYIFVLFIGALSIKVTHRKDLKGDLKIFDKIQKDKGEYYLALSRKKMTDREIMSLLEEWKVIAEPKKYSRMGDKRAVDYIAGKVKA